jgi:hypothetical protein
MPYWTERMTVSWLRMKAPQGAQVRERAPGVYDVVWPGGRRNDRVSFLRADAEIPDNTALTMEDPRVRELTRIPPYVPGLPVVRLVIPEVSNRVNGFWSLWRVGLSTLEGRAQRIVPVFVTNEGQVLHPTARVIWDRLIELGAGLELHPPPVAGGDENRAFEQSRAAAEEQGQTLFSELLQNHREGIGRENRKMAAAFAARRRAIERLGLPQVRDFRLAQLAEEETAWRSRHTQREHAMPELSPLLLAAIIRAENRT